MGGQLGIASGLTPQFGYGQQQPWGFSTLGTQGLQGTNINPYATQPPYATQLLSGQPQLHQQIAHQLQIVSQQLQQLQQQQYVQQQQLQQLQQIQQIVPTQLAQLQQLLVQTVQQTQQGQQFGQVPTLTSPWAASPQLFGAQPGQVM
jgi:hypothetical protein